MCGHMPITSFWAGAQQDTTAQKDVMSATRRTTYAICEAAYGMSSIWHMVTTMAHAQ